MNSKFKILISGVLLLLPVFLILSGCKNEITITDLLNNPFPSEMVVSKKGDKLAFVIYNQGERNIYLAQGEDFGQVKKLTNYIGDQGVEINSLQFLASGEQLIFVRGNSYSIDNEPANPANLPGDLRRTLHVVSIESGEITKIGPGRYPKTSPTRDEVIYINEGNIWIAKLDQSNKPPKSLIDVRGRERWMRWSPDGNKIAFVLYQNDSTTIGIYEIKTGQINYSEKSEHNNGELTWSPDSKSIAYVRIPASDELQLAFGAKKMEAPWSIRLLSIDSMNSTELWKADPGMGSSMYLNLPIGDNQIHWPIDQYIVFPWEKNGWLQMYALDLSNKKARLITPGNGEVQQLSFTNSGNEMYYATNALDLDRRHIWKTEIASGEIKQLTFGKGIEVNPIMTKEGLVGLGSTATSSIWPFILKNKQQNSLLKGLQNEQDFRKLPIPFSETIKASDELESRAIIFLPGQYDPKRTYPAIIYLHGGSRRQMMAGFHPNFYYHNAYALNQYFASKGFIVMALNYRSGTGYGLAFREAEDFGVNGASELLDLLATHEYLEKRGDVNLEEIFLWGGSYGGNLVAHGLSQYSHLFAGGVDIHGIHDWNIIEPRFSQYDPDQFPEIARTAAIASPESYVDTWKSPVLFIHGDKDRTVPVSESKRLAEKLIKRGVPVKSIILNNEPHDFLLHESWTTQMLETAKFIEALRN